MRSSLHLLTLALALGAPGAALAQGADAEAVARAAALGDRIETDTVPSRSGVAFGRAVGVVDAPVDQVMAVITDYGRYEDFLPHFRQSRVLARRGNNALVYLQASVVRNTTTLWAQMRIYARRSRGETRIIEGRMTDGNMLSFVARWEVTPVAEDRSLVNFRILVEPDLPFPDSVFTGENVKAARRTIRAVRRQVREPRYTAPRRR